MPEPPLTPQDTKFDPQLPATVLAWHTRSGHVLVKPKLNGQDVGYMMLDTGESWPFKHTHEWQCHGGNDIAGPSSSHMSGNDMVAMTQQQ